MLPGPIPTFTASARRRPALGAVGVATLPRGCGVGEARADAAPHQHPLLCACDESTTSRSTFAAPRRGAFEVVPREPTAPPRAAAPARPCSVGVLHHLLDVLDGDQAAQVALRVDHQQLLDLVLVQQRLGLLERGALGDGDQVLLGHQLGDRLVELGLPAQVAVGEDAHELAVIVGHRHAGDLEVRHQLEGGADRLVGAHRHRVDDHPRLGALDAVDLGRLRLDRHVLVDDADAALLRQRDREARLGHRAIAAESTQLSVIPAHSVGRRPPPPGDLR